MKVIAVIGLTNTDVIEILDIKHGIEDKVQFRIRVGDSCSARRTHKIRYDEDGEAYFISQGQKHYLSTAIRTN